MVEYGMMVIAIAAVSAVLLVFCSPQCVFDRIFPDSVYAINVFTEMADRYSMNVFPQFFGEKTIKLLKTWKFISVRNPTEAITGSYEFDVTLKGKKNVEIFQNNKYGVRLFVIGKLLEKSLKYILPLIGAHILFAWYKFYEIILDKLFN